MIESLNQSKNIFAYSFMTWLMLLLMRKMLKK